jgi:hypothetical protein
LLKCIISYRYRYPENSESEPISARVEEDVDRVCDEPVEVGGDKNCLKFRSSLKGLQVLGLTGFGMVTPKHGLEMHIVLCQKRVPREAGIEEVVIYEGFHPEE